MLNGNKTRLILTTHLGKQQILVRRVCRSRHIVHTRHIGIPHRSHSRNSGSLIHQIFLFKSQNGPFRQLLVIRHSLQSLQVIEVVSVYKQSYRSSFSLQTVSHLCRHQGARPGVAQSFSFPYARPCWNEQH